MNKNYNLISICTILLFCPIYSIAGELLDISTRGYVGAGDDQLIAGFIIRGDSPKTVLIKAMGPSLAKHGVANVLADPKLQIIDQSTGSIIASNDDWSNTEKKAEIIALDMAPEEAKESAVLETLKPGAYTALVSGYNSATGIGLVNVTDVQLCNNDKFWGEYSGTADVYEAATPPIFFGELESIITKLGKQFSITIGDNQSNIGNDDYLYIPQCGNKFEIEKDGGKINVVINEQTISIFIRNNVNTSVSMAHMEMIFSQDSSEMRWNFRQLHGFLAKFTYFFVNMQRELPKIIPNPIPIVPQN